MFPHKKIVALVECFFSVPAITIICCSWACTTSLLCYYS